ncbi:MAG: ATP-dependent helicase [Phycisphaerae bacterium]|nr:ATP-dependent helicase [Phycisphaerae bacterium]
MIILDEFQDTNADEWRLIQSLGQHSRLIALADPEQRIYEFRGADPARIGDFINAYAPAQFDFSGENHRSNGTDIVNFGNDLLTGANKSSRYSDVTVVSYGFYRDRSQHFAVKAALIHAMRRCIASKPGDWSIAVLVPSKRFMLTVSDYLSAEADGFPALSHDVALDTEGPAIAAELIAGLLDSGVDIAYTAATLIRELCAHIRGRRGTTPPTKNDLKLTDALSTYLETGAARGSTRLALIADCQRIAVARKGMTLTGDPEADWLAVRQLLADSEVAHIQQVAEDAKYLRLLHKGALLRARLGDLWRGNRGYPGAAEAVHDALLQEHFSASTRVWKGVNVMTIHKSKGKEFDEVIVYEGAYQGRIVRAEASAREIAQARLSLRVAVTRAMTRTTLLTPQSNPCPFL